MDSVKTISPTKIRKRTILAAAVMACLTLLPGCNIIYRTSIREPDYYYINPNKSLIAVGRAVLIEMDNESTYPQISADMTEALFRALQKKQLFSLAVIHQTDPAWKSLQLDTNSQYTLDQLSAMRKTLKCNAVMVGTVTTYQPYTHMTIGIRLKLVDLSDGQLLWAFEQVWDATDKITAKRIENYLQAQIRDGFAPLRGDLLAISPLKFVKFVAYEVAETL